jgi:hypothetical protein
MTAIASAAAPARRDRLTRRIRLLVAATMSYNVIEAVIAVTAGTIASSAALTLRPGLRHRGLLRRRRGRLAVLRPRPRRARGP